MLLNSRAITLLLKLFIFIFPFMIFIRQPNGDLHHALPKVVLLCLFSLLLWLIFLSRWLIHKKTITSKINRVEGGLLLLVALIIVSTILSVDPYTSLYGTRYRYEGAFALFSYFTLFFFSYHFIAIKDHKKVFIGLTIGAFLSAIYGIIQHYNPMLFKLSHIRTESFYDHANFFGSYLVLMMLVVSTLFLLSEKLSYLITLFVVNATLCFALILTTTRSGWLGTSFGLLFITFFVILKRKYLWKRWVIQLIGFVLVFIFLNLSQGNEYLQRANTIVRDAGLVLEEDVESRDSVGSNRGYIWRNALPLVDDHLLFGSGPDTFALVFPQKWEGVIVDKAHNEYLQILITLGLPALIIYLYILFQVLLKGFRKAFKLEGKNQIIQFGLLAVIVGYLLQAFFNISVILVAPFYWILLGILYRRSKDGSLLHSSKENMVE